MREVFTGPKHYERLYTKNRTYNKVGTKRRGFAMFSKLIYKLTVLFSGWRSLWTLSKHQGVSGKYIDCMHSGNKEENIRSDSQLTYFMFLINIFRNNKVKGKHVKHIPLSKFLQKVHFWIFCFTNSETCFTLRAGCRQGNRNCQVVQILICTFYNMITHVSHYQ